MCHEPNGIITGGASDGPSSRQTSWSNVWKHTGIQPLDNLALQPCD